MDDTCSKQGARYVFVWVEVENTSNIWHCAGFLNIVLYWSTLVFCSLHYKPMPYRTLPAVLARSYRIIVCRKRRGVWLAWLYSPHTLWFMTAMIVRRVTCVTLLYYLCLMDLINAMWQLFIKAESDIYYSTNMAENGAVICKPPYISILVSRGGAQNGQYSNFQELSLCLQLDIHNVWFYQEYTWRTVKAHASNV